MEDQPRNDYPLLDEAIRLAHERGMTGDIIFAELGGDNLVKAHLRLGEGIVVQFTAMSTVDYDGSPTDIGWDAWDAVTTGSLKGGSAGGDGGVATTPAEAVNAVCAFLVGGGFATFAEDALTLQSAVERVTKVWTVTFTGDRRIAEAVEMGLKVMADTVFDMADADELGLEERDLDILCDEASVEVTDAEGTVIA